MNIFIIYTGNLENIFFFLLRLSSYKIKSKIEDTKMTALYTMNILEQNN